MSARDVRQWLLASADSLSALGVSGVVGRSPDCGTVGPASWISFASEIGSGRVVRHAAGDCHTSALRHADGVVLIDRCSPVTTSMELAAVVSAITPFRRGHDRRES